MWIRNQYKKLLGDYKFIFVFDNEIRAESNMDVDILGKYKSEERAIEVLNEIQNAVWQNINNDPRIYEMPEN